jgi:hypothetical protein
VNWRLSERVWLQIRVIVETEIEQGKPVRLEAFTISVSAHGGLLEMGLRVQEGQKMLLTNPAVGVRQGCRVLRVRSSRNGSFAVAFEFDCPTPQFWSIAFPLADGA